MQPLEHISSGHNHVDRETFLSTGLNLIHDESTPTMDDLGIEEVDPAEGVLDYTTLPQTIVNWYQNEYVRPEQRGSDIFKLLDDYWGVDRSTALACPELQSYWRYKFEGRFISMAAMQYDNPTPYFLTNLLNLAQIYKSSNGQMPTAFMVMEYPQDMFSFKNGDKTGAVFDSLSIPYINDLGELSVWSTELNPTAVIQREDQIKKGQEPLRILQDGRYLVKTFELSTNPDGSSSNNAQERHQKQFKNKECRDIVLSFDPELLEGLGVSSSDVEILHIDNNLVYLRSTDFYKALWNSSIRNFRDQGYLPSEEEMPIFTVDVFGLYKYFADHADPSQKFLSTQEWDNLPIRIDGMMRGDAYYLLQPRWPDLYIECSSCMCLTNPRFSHALPRHDHLRKAAGVSSTEVRLPDVELGSCGLETLTILDPNTFPDQYKAYMKSLYLQLDDPIIQNIFNNLYR